MLMMIKDIQFNEKGRRLVKVKELPEDQKQAMLWFGWDDEDEVPFFAHNIEDGPDDQR